MPTLTGGTQLPVLCFVPPLRYVVLPQPVCLERGVSYTLRLELGCAATRQDPTASVLIDSVRGGQAAGWGQPPFRGAGCGHGERQV